MTQGTVLEVVLFRSAEVLTVDQMVQAADDIQTWLKDQPGYLDRTLAKDDTGLWLDVVSWTSLTEAQQAADTIMQMAVGRAFGAAIDGPSIQMFHLEALAEILISQKPSRKLRSFLEGVLRRDLSHHACRLGASPPGPGKFRPTSSAPLRPARSPWRVRRLELLQVRGP